MKDHMVLIIIIFLFMTTFAMIQSQSTWLGEGKEQIFEDVTGNVVGVRDSIEQRIQTKSPANQTNKPKIQPACDTTCTPAGITCSDDALRICQDMDGDGCLDLTTIECIYGCNKEQSSCRTKGKGEIEKGVSKEERVFERKRLTIAQSDLLRQPITKVETQDNCTGSMQGVIEWNPDQSVCRKNGVNTPIAGYTTVLNCCKRFFYQSSCTKNFGMMKRGLVMSSQFFAVGCYE